MTRFAFCTLAGIGLWLVTVNPVAATTRGVDLRDPTIWEEKPLPQQPWKYVPCEVESGPHCPTLEAEKSSIQRERERREWRDRSAIYRQSKKKD